MVKHSMNVFNHDVPPAEAAMVNVCFEGEWVQVPKGLNVIEVARRMGKFLPHYCYHPKLQVVGNCRVCLFEMGTPKLDAEKKPVVGADGKPEIAWMPRPQIGCATQVSEGMGIRISSPLAHECRKSVMEFLLINHPLDCPICDEAGECKLQEFAVEYGPGKSRFVEEKVHKPKKVDLGERIVLDDERCILCSRCIRFAKDTMKDDVLGFVDRGSHTTLTAHPGRRFDNEYSLNTIDICPVGALTSKDFRFQMRVWFLKETKSFCTSCATGCNMVIGSRENKVYRLTPRPNEEVNSEWMCDYGRLNFHYLHDPKRLMRPMTQIRGEFFQADWENIYAQLNQRLLDFNPSQVAVVGSGRMTNEELFLLKEWTEALGIDQVDIVPHTWEGDTFLKSKDRSPNSAGARLLGVSKDGVTLKQIREKVRQAEVKVLFAFQEDLLEAGFTQGDLKNLELLVCSGLLENETTRAAHYILPASGFAEKRGSMINAMGRLQRLNRAIMPPGEAREDWEILLGLQKATQGLWSKTVNSHATKPVQRSETIEEIFAIMAAKHQVFEGLSLSKIGDLGIPLMLTKAGV